MRLHRLLYEPVVRAALVEDLGRAGDLTTDSIVGEGDRGVGRIVARQAGVAAGVEVACCAFTLYEPTLEVEIGRRDGETVAPGDVLAVISGPARGLLTAERTALNLLGRLCGIASATNQVVAAVAGAGTGAAVVCTRKTTPGLRALEKYAVRCGGGSNHRFGLDDAVLIKDNHIALAGGVAEALVRVKGRVGHLVKVEIEVDTLDQLDEVLALAKQGVAADAVLLDNFDPAELAEAVRRVAGSMITEASGGITLESARATAQAGVDLLSLGWLTHSSASLDVGLDL
ncbi:MAG: carboxylating nicotinate-nucleotide diphosphorylase [Acidimicrobiales bacterium]